MACKECVKNKTCRGAIDNDKKSVKLIIAMAKKNDKECPIHKWRR